MESKCFLHGRNKAGLVFNYQLDKTIKQRVVYVPWEKVLLNQIIIKMILGPPLSAI